MALSQYPRQPLIIGSQPLHIQEGVLMASLFRQASYILSRLLLLKFLIFSTYFAFYFYSLATSHISLIRISLRTPRLSVDGSLVVIHVYEFKVAGSSGKNYTLNSTQSDVIDFKFYFRFWYFLRDLNSHPFGPSFELGVSADSTKEVYGCQDGIRTHMLQINSLLSYQIDYLALYKKQENRTPFLYRTYLNPPLI